MSDIFISYKREDRDKAKALAEFFTFKGFDVWWDIDLLAGTQFADEINSVLNKAKAAIVLWTPEARESRWVKSEASLANSRNILVPVFLEKTDLPVPFNILHTHDLTTWNGQHDDPVLESLVGVIERLTRKSEFERKYASKQEIRQVLNNPEIEFKFWEAVTSQQPQSVLEYQLYLEKFGDDCWFANLAKSRIKQLSKTNDGSDGNDQTTDGSDGNDQKASVSILGITIPVKKSTACFLLCLGLFGFALWNWETIIDKTRGLQNYLTFFEPVEIPSLRLRIEPRSGVVNNGDPFTVNWTTKRAETVTLDGNEVSANDTVTFYPETTTTYRFIATSKTDDQKKESVKVTVDPVEPVEPVQIPSLRLRIEPRSGVVNNGDPFTVHWTTKRAARVRLDGVEVSANDTVTFYPETTTTYRFIATSETGHSDIKVVTITVRP